MRRRVLGKAGVGVDGRVGTKENFVAGGSGRLFEWRVLTPQREKSAAEPVAEQQR